MLRKGNAHVALGVCDRQRKRDGADSRRFVCAGCNEDAMSSVMVKEGRPGSQTSGKDRNAGLGLLVLSFLVSVFISWKSKEIAEPVFSRPPDPPSSDGISGFPDAVRPRALLPRAKELTLRDQLVGLVAVGVKPDGTVDVSLQGAQVRYVFQSKKGEGPEPPRPPNRLARQHYCGVQGVRLDQNGLGAEVDRPSASCDDAVEGLPPPRCELEHLWLLAKEKGADQRTAATVTYYRAAAGPAYWFQSAYTQFHVGADCQTLLSGDDAAGIIPERIP